MHALTIHLLGTLFNVEPLLIAIYLRIATWTKTIQFCHVSHIIM